MKTLVTLWMALAVVANLNSQGYTSMLLDYDRVPNASHFIEIDDGNFLIKSLNSVDDTAATSLIIVDSSFEVVEIIDYKNILFTRNCPLRGEANRYHFFATDAQKEDAYFFGILDQDFNIDTLRQMIYEVEDGGATAFDYSNGSMLGAIASFYDCDGRTCGYIELLNYDQSTSNITIDHNERYFFTFEVDHLMDSSIITGGNRAGDFQTNAAIYSLSQSGDILWKYTSTDEQSRGNVPVWVEELSDRNIIYSDKIKDPESLFEPTKVVWLSPQGDSLMHWVDQGYTEKRIEINGLQTGQGDYFFVYGFYSADGPENRDYGYIYKIANDGQVLWQHKYQHIGYEDDFHYIADLIELDNGDIVTLGSVDIQNIWMMRLDKHGCFGEEDCGEEVIYTSTTETVLPSPTAVLYPSPATGELYIHTDYHGRYYSATIYSTDGTMVHQQDLAHDATIDISMLLPGSYIATLRDTDGRTYSQKIAVY